MNKVIMGWLAVVVLAAGAASLQAGIAAAGAVNRYQLTAGGSGPAGGVSLGAVDFHLHPNGWATLNATERANVGQANDTRRWSFETDLGNGPSFQRASYNSGAAAGLGSVRWTSANGFSKGTAFKAAYSDVTGTLANIWTCWNADPNTYDPFRSHWGTRRNLDVLAGEFVDAPAYAWFGSQSWNGTARYYTKRAHDTASANGNYTGIYFNVTSRNGGREEECVNNMRAYGCGQQSWVAECFSVGDSPTWQRILTVARYCRDH